MLFATVTTGNVARFGCTSASSKDDLLTACADDEMCLNWRFLVTLAHLSPLVRLELIAPLVDRNLQFVD